MVETVKNYINGQFVASKSTQTTDVINPATMELLCRTPAGHEDDLNAAVEAAKAAFPAWRDTPAVDRVQYFFNFKTILEQHYEELATLIVKEHGKTYKEALGDVRRAIQMVETAIGLPALLRGEFKDNVARNIDSMAQRRPLGVFACIAPFNFPAMVPYWFWPFAVAAGNTYIIKPSELVPLTQVRMFELIHEAGFPKGVVNMVHGGKDTGNQILTHPGIKGISFVGSTAVAKHIYSTGTAHGKRVQALGGAKNCLVILPDASMEKSVQAMVESCYGCAGERCLAGSVLVGVGPAYNKMKELAVKYAKDIVVGDGMDPKTTMGPVVTAAAKQRILDDINKAIEEGAELILDGRPLASMKGNFIGPTIFDHVKPDSILATKEIFGPVIGLMQVKDLDEAIALINSSNYGNTASLFTSNGAAVRHFIQNVHPSMVGINLGVPAPMSIFGFGGSKDSFFGDIKGQIESIDFFTEKHISMIRWFSEDLTDVSSPHWST
ncbi:MAG: methylmalonate-semialdehyde dehydrogenase (CoA acylating) [Deltaproteobacteria bacterium HGW-Deltaproteobacteria-17]|nr:MAG: methylmalonate-semialdehyde dehydrogenase (CoA acylating) [Deltaproteobacteria bacterium HGW-Deltaproteobacteria-17]